MVSVPLYLARYHIYLEVSDRLRTYTRTADRSTTGRRPPVRLEKVFLMHGLPPAAKMSAPPPAQALINRRDLVLLPKIGDTRGPSYWRNIVYDLAGIRVSRHRQSPPSFTFKVVRIRTPGWR